MCSSLNYLWKCNVEAVEEIDGMSRSILKLDLSGNWH